MREPAQKWRCAFVAAIQNPGEMPVAPGRSMFLLPEVKATHSGLRKPHRAISPESLAQTQRRQVAETVAATSADPEMSIDGLIDILEVARRIK